MVLSLLSETFAVCKLPVGSPVPEWAFHGSFSSVTTTDEELSIVCDQSFLREGRFSNISAEYDWRALKVAGPLDFSLTGILSSLAAPLAEAEISIFAVSTFNTDYILVKQKDLDEACAVLQQRAGCSITR